MLEVMINAEVKSISSASADTMLLPFLRENLDLTGSKEGCASGDCGACTVVVAELLDGELNYRQINSCITPLHSLHGKHIITVEHLKQNEKLHPVQQAVVDQHGTQCGFCTPGFVMSLYTLSKQKSKPENPAEYLAGNLCRCTGYGPLIEAANSIANTTILDPLDKDCEKVIEWMQSVRPMASSHYFTPHTRSELAHFRAQYPSAKLIAGGTDLSLEVTQKLQTLEYLIDISRVDDLLTITQTDKGWRLGSAIPMTQIHQFMLKHYPSTGEVIERLGSMTIRQRATLGGSLGHASPIGDIAPLLISLKGEIEVDNGTDKKCYSPEDFITGYRQTRLAENEWISGIHLPNLKSSQKHAIYKVSKRYEDDIATVVLAVNFTFDEQNLISDCIVSAGGIAAKSVRLTELEYPCLGKPLTQTLINQLKQHVPSVITPLSDVRGSAEYRVTLVQNLLQRFFLEYQQIETRLTYHA
ncbi:xanthine dehydrogenase small subunit [Vibrio sp.]|nr:xanthine dehydrogenase small subunit [Vibrio sp.]